MTNEYSFNVKFCARCELEHKDVVFKKLSIAEGEFTHWGVCPTTGEPIMMIVQELDN